MSERLVQALALALFALLFGVGLVMPLGVLAMKSLTDESGFTLAHYARAFGDARLLHAGWNSLWVGALTAAITTPLAFVFAFGLARARFPGKPLFGAIGSAPILVPSLLPALALVYLFGAQGLFRPLMGEASILGWPGIALANVVATFPHAFLILRTTLASADGRLYEAGETLGASGPRMFWSVTLPAARHGIVSAALVVFILTIADVGAPKVVGGSFDVLALEIYKQVLGQQDFALGGVIAIALLATTVAALVVERWAAAHATAGVSARAVPFTPKRDAARDGALFAACAAIALTLVVILGVCQIAALARFWPYDLSPTLRFYALERYANAGWGALWGSLALAAMTAAIGTPLVFAGAYLAEKLKGFRLARGALTALALTPAAAPGLALGLAYALAFSDPTNPFGFLYQTLAILVLATIIHLYTVSHLTAVAAMKSLDPDFETAAAVLGRPFWSVAFAVTAPLTAPAMLEVALYVFVNAMTTVSVVVFLYGPNTPLAAVSVLNMDDAGDVAPAAALGMMIFYVNLVVRLGGEAALAWMRRPHAIGRALA